MKEIKDHIIKLTGKISILEPIELGHNYQIKLDSTVTQSTEVDNHDGSINKVYKIEPVVGEILKDNGEILKIKDQRRNSEKIRKACYAVWSTKTTNIDSDEMYDRVTRWVLLNMEYIQDAICKKE